MTAVAESLEMVLVYVAVWRVEGSTWMLLGWNFLVWRRMNNLDRGWRRGENLGGGGYYLA